MVTGEILPVENLPAEQPSLAGVDLVPGALKPSRRQGLHPAAEIFGRFVEVAVANRCEEMIDDGIVGAGFGGASGSRKDGDCGQENAQGKCVLQHPMQIRKLETCAQ